MIAPTTRVLLMRHADVENPQKVIYGHLPGFGLSAYGRAQAAAVGQSLRDSGVRRIVHSPLDRARETAEIINAQLPSPVPLFPEPALREADIGRYLQGVPRWQIPIRRPGFFVHKLRRGTLAGDETIEALGRRVLDVVDRVAREHPGEVSLLISHADPLQAAWILLDGRPQTEREMFRKSVGKAAMLELDYQNIPSPSGGGQGGGRVVSTRYIPSPKPQLTLPL